MERHMDAAEALGIVKQHFERWLTHVAMNVSAGEIRLGFPYSFPSMIRMAESPHHYIAELCGATAQGLGHPVVLCAATGVQRVPSATAFLNPGFYNDTDEAGPAALTVNISGMLVRRVTLCTPFDREAFENKVNFRISPTQVIPENCRTPIVVRPEVGALLLRSVDIVRSDSFRLLFRSISTAVVIGKKMTSAHLAGYLWNTCMNCLHDDASKDIIGLNSGFDASCGTFARELASLAAQDVGEALLDGFIQAHAGLFARALGYRKALSQVRLAWVERDEDDPQASIPDYAMEREDGFFDILDLKRALLRCRSVTVGSKPRLRLNAYVSELVAQLAGYERYFRKPANAAWALKEYGIRVKSPRLVGVVGSYDSFDRGSVDTALEPYRRNIVVLSYADVVSLLKRRS
jgi:hypothetical protein